MLFRKNIVSMRALLQLAVASAICVGGVGTALAATFSGYTGAAPELMPYQVYGLAGYEQPAPGTTVPNTSTTPAGYGGDGLTGTQAYFNGPNAVAVDAAGNVFIADTNNFIIRELNAQTGIVNTIAGVHPTVCGGLQGIACSKSVSGCSDGVPALNDPIGGKIEAIAVDENDNVYFGDSNTFTLSVIFHGGTRVANFIKLVNPAGVSKAGGVIPGYVYHIAGTINLSTCVGTKGTTSATDNLPAYQSAQLNNVVNTGGSDIALDSAGNIYLSDLGNGVVRVINTQSTPQQFFQYVVQPGYIKGIVNCGALTTACAGPVTTTSNTGITLPPNTPQNPTTVVDGPANLVSFGPATTLRSVGVDGYGNIYQLDGASAVPNMYLQSAYAGGAPLAKLEGVLWKGVNIAYGDAYETSNDVSLNTSLPHYYDNVLANSYGGTGGAMIRPIDATADPLGNVWALDNHWPSIFRIDANSGILLDVIGYGGGNKGLDQVPSGTDLTNQQSQYGTYAAPIYCITGFGTVPFGAGPLSYDTRLDGCPGIDSYTSANGALVSDGYGNILDIDPTAEELRVIALDNTFPATPVGNMVVQPIDIHFDASNPPVVTGFTTAAITLASGSTPGTPGSQDFSFDETDPEFQALPWLHSNYAVPGSANANNGSASASQLAMYAGPPSCIQNAISAGDQSWDCLVYVTFDPTAPGLRTNQLQVVTQPVTPLGVAGPLAMQTYYFPLTGVGLGAQIAIDGGTPVTVPAIGLGTTPSVAVASNNQIFIADPTNNRIVICTPGSGSLCKTQANMVMAWPQSYAANQQTLSGPMGVAVDTANNVYISDTGNNRILEGTPELQVGAPLTYLMSVIGGIPWVSCAPTAAPFSSPPTVGKPCSVIPAGTLPPTNTNITAAQTALGLPAPAAVTPGPIPVYNPLQQYLFSGPEGLAVDLNGNVYVADTGNSAVVIIPKNPVLGGATPMFQYAGAPTFVSPVAVAVDGQNNIYVADTGNPFQQVVKIPPGGGDLQTLLPLDSSLPLIGGQGLTTPSGVAVDAGENVFISDAASNAIWEAPAAGPPTQPFQLTNLSAAGLSSPLGLALDSGGNLYVANSAADQILYVNRQAPMVNYGAVPQDLGVGTGVPGTPSGCLQGGSTTPCTGVLTLTNIGRTTAILNLPFPFVTSVPVTYTPGSAVLTLASGTTAGIPIGVAINGEFAGVNGAAEPTSFIATGTTIVATSAPGVTPATITMSVPVAATVPVSTGPVTATYLNLPTTTVSGSAPNLINGTLALTSPVASITSGSSTFTVSGTTCSTTLPPGATCTVSPVYTPTADVTGQSATLTVNGTQSVALVANGGAPQAHIVLTPVYSGGAPAGGGTATYTATVSQPHTPPGGTPTGTVTFNFVVDGGLYAAGSCGTVASQTVTLSGGVASTTAIPLLQGRVYSVTAVYNGDANDSPVNASLTTTVPGTAITATISSPPSFVYGATPPVLSGTITGVDSTVTAKFVSGASQFSPVSGSPYPITVAFSNASAGGDYCNYLSPTTGAFVTETAAPLSETVPPVTAPYGAPNINFTLQLTLTGAVNNDGNKITPLYYIAPLNVTTVSGSPVLTVVGGTTLSGNVLSSGNTGAAVAGAAITGPGIPTGATVLSSTPTSITISANETETNTTAVPISYLISPALAVSASPVYASPAATSILTLAGSPWTISPSLSGKPITLYNDYNVTYHPITLTITQAPTQIAASIAATSELPTATVTSGVAISAVTKANDSISVSTAVPGGSGTPSGTVTVLDTITNIASNGVGLATTELPCTVPFTGITSAGSPVIFVSSNYDLFVGDAVNGGSTLTANTTSGSPVLSGVQSGNTILYPGEIVTGAGIPANATIVSVGQGVLTLSASATATAAGVTVSAYIIPSGATITFVGITPSVAFSASTTLGSAVLTAYTNLNGNTLYQGATVTGPGIPVGAYVVSIAANSVKISAPAAATATGVTLSTTAAPSITLSANATTSIPAVQLSEVTPGTPCTSNTPSVTETTGSAVLTAMSSILNIAPGQPVSGPGIPANATVVSLGATSFTAAPSSGSTTLPLVSPATTTGLGLTVNEPLTGLGIAPGAVISSIASGSVVMSIAATASEPTTAPSTVYAGNQITISAPATATGTNNSFTATATPGSNVLTAVSSTANLVPGEPISGGGIPVSTTNPTTIVSVGTGTVTMSTPVPTSFAFTATTTLGSAVLTSPVNASSFIFAVGDIVSGTGIPSGATIVSVSPLTLSANATASGTAVALTAVPIVVVGEAVTSPITISTPYAVLLSAQGAQGVFIPTSVVLGMHQYAFAYSGDSNFLPSTLTPPGVTPATPACNPYTTGGLTVTGVSCLLVDNADFALSSNTPLLQVVAGVVPSSNGLLPAPLQNSSYPQSAPINVLSLSGEAGAGFPVTLSCLPIGNPYATSFTASTTSGSAILTGVLDTVASSLAPGDIVVGPGIPTGATVASVGAITALSTTTTVTLSSSATATGSGVTVSYVVPPPVGAGTTAVLTATTTFGSPVLTGVSSTTNLVAGEPISGAGIIVGSTIVSVGSSTITISSNATASGAGVTVFSYIPPGNPPSITNSASSSSYITCSMTPPNLTLTSGASATSVLSVQIPLNEPVNYQFFSQVRMPGSETLLAFLPLGVLAFCTRRRRRLSKALWMLLVIAIVTAGIGGCGAHYSVDLQSPFPAGPQYVQVTAVGTSSTNSAPLVRTFLVEIYIN